DHASRMLAEMTGQVLDPRPEMGKVTHHRRLRIAAGLPEMNEERIARILVLPVAHQPRETIAEGGGQPERFAHLAGRAPAAIRDDVRGHGRAQPAVTLVDVLDHLLTPIAARQVEIDVGPLTALLGEKAL